MWELVGNPEDRFSHNEAHLITFSICSGEDDMEHVYMKPWCRIGPYAVGVFAGYILYKTNCKLHMPKVNKPYLQVQFFHRKLTSQIYR